MKEEALKLADELLRDNTQLSVESAYMIRRLVERIDSQEKHLKNKDDFIVTLIKPLSEETIEELREYHGINDWMYETSIVDFVRAVEKAHGIQ